MGEVLTLREVSGPAPPGTDDVVVRMIASTVNPSDVLTIAGAHGSRTTFPFVPGFEGVGVIESAGCGVPRELIGQRVLPLGSAGSWQQLRRADWRWCVPAPADLPDEIARFAHINPLTAHLMVERFCTRAVRNVLITGAARPSPVISPSSSLRAGSPLQGCTGALRAGPGRTAACGGAWSRRTVPAGRSRCATRRRAASMGFDCVGGAAGTELIDQLSAGGALVHYGLLSGAPLPAACFDGRRGTRVELFRLRDVIHTLPRERLPSLFAPVFEQLRTGRLLTHPSVRADLSELPAALAPPPHRKVDLGP
ncbi:alcohol dehydrogenase catalytic domain-containing protein [Saccharopolyspora hirsuta]|uniref:alcohol dehydrogenase catalytic domain-containing protein n=1 Tax=Saccharopolyspora hirsuta TaxID=1837 RepID=UPI0033326B31